MSQRAAWIQLEWNPRPARLSGPSQPDWIPRGGGLALRLFPCSAFIRSWKISMALPPSETAAARNFPLPSPRRPWLTLRSKNWW